MINEDALKQRIQRWIVCGSVAIMAGKFLAFWLTNSVGILTDAVESIVNVTAGFISLYSLYLAAKPKDAGHPFRTWQGRVDFRLDRRIADYHCREASSSSKVSAACSNRRK